MQSVFLSQHFEEPDGDLVAATEALIESLGLLIIRGDALGGSVISSGVQRKLESCDACIALATPDSRRPDGTYRTYPWVQNELVMARTLKKRCIAILHESVTLDGVFTENEYVKYAPGKPLPAFTKLAATLGIWRRESGRQMKVLVLPPELAQLLGSNAETATCEYRYYDSRGKAGPWEKAGVVPAQGGPVVYLDGAQEDCLMEVRVKVGRQSWSSRATAPYAQVELKKERR